MYIGISLCRSILHRLSFRNQFIYKRHKKRYNNIKKLTETVNLEHRKLTAATKTAERTKIATPIITIVYQYMVNLSWGKANPFESTEERESGEVFGPKRFSTAANGQNSFNKCTRWLNKDYDKIQTTNTHLLTNSEAFQSQVREYIGDGKKFTNKRRRKLPQRNYQNK